MHKSKQKHKLKYKCDVQSVWAFIARNDPQHLETCNSACHPEVYGVHNFPKQGGSSPPQDQKILLGEEVDWLDQNLIDDLHRVWPQLKEHNNKEADKAWWKEKVREHFRNTETSLTDYFKLAIEIHSSISGWGFKINEAMTLENVKAIVAQRAVVCVYQANTMKLNGFSMLPDDVYLLDSVNVKVDENGCILQRPFVVKKRLETKSPKPGVDNSTPIDKGTIVVPFGTIDDVLGALKAGAKPTIQLDLDLPTPPQSKPGVDNSTPIDKGTIVVSFGTIDEVLGAVKAGAKPTIQLDLDLPTDSKMHNG